jgi:hypothetical protein
VSRMVTWLVFYTLRTTNECPVKWPIGYRHIDTTL